MWYSRIFLLRPFAIEHACETKIKIIISKLEKATHWCRHCSAMGPIKPRREATSASRKLWLSTRLMWPEYKLTYGGLLRFGERTIRKCPSRMPEYINFSNLDQPGVATRSSPSPSRWRSWTPWRLPPSSLYRHIIRTFTIRGIKPKGKQSKSHH